MVNNASGSRQKQNNKQLENIEETIRIRKHTGTLNNGPPKVLSRKKSKIAKTKAIIGFSKTVPVLKAKKTIAEERKETLEEKYRRMQREEFVSRFTFKCRCDNIKSAGNGL